MLELNLKGPKELDLDNLVSAYERNHGVVIDWFHDPRTWKGIREYFERTGETNPDPDGVALRERVFTEQLLAS